MEANFFIFFFHFTTMDDLITYFTSIYRVELCIWVSMLRQFVGLHYTWLQKFFSSRDMMTRYELSPVSVPCVIINHKIIIGGHVECWCHSL